MLCLYKFINPRRACARVIVVVQSVCVFVCVCVCVRVCVSVKSHLASGASVCPENAVKYSVCNVVEEVEIFVGFSLKLSFQSYILYFLHCTVTVKSAILPLGIRA